MAPLPPGSARDGRLRVGRARRLALLRLRAQCHVALVLLETTTVKNSVETLASLLHAG